MHDIINTAAPTNPTMGLRCKSCCPRVFNSRSPRKRNGADTANHSSAHCTGRIPSVMCIANAGTADSTSNNVKTRTAAMKRCLFFIPVYAGPQIQRRFNLSQCHDSYNPTRLWDRIRGNDSALRKSECVRNEQPSPNAAEYHSVHMVTRRDTLRPRRESGERTRTDLPGPGTFPLVAAPVALHH